MDLASAQGWSRNQLRGQLLLAIGPSHVVHLEVRGPRLWRTAAEASVRLGEEWITSALADRRCPRALRRCTTI
jgi:hypothetical protein